MLHNHPRSSIAKRLALHGMAIAAMLTGCSISSGKTPDFDLDLAKDGLDFLQKHCQRCHHDDNRYPGLDVLDRATMLDPGIDGEDPFLVPENLEETRIWDVVVEKYMPPESQAQPTAAEKKRFKQWVEAGANFPPAQRKNRPFVGEATILNAIEQDLRNLDPEDIRFIRYFSLAHLWNDTSGSDPTTEEDLRLIRAGLSKLLNSLSTQPRIAIPRQIEAEFRTILAIDIRDYGWSVWHWEQLQASYPYALKLNGRTALRIYELTGTPVPYLRADWFIATASRPPLYHLLLRLPSNAKTLEESLGVNVAKNFLDGRLARAAFQKSGVSQQNRMVERHDPPRGRYYWKSYDMKPGTAQDGDFTRSPTGPVFNSIQTGLPAFLHDGGEIIWSLSNGMQAYLLVDGRDKRIDQGPPDVVFDPNSHGGSFLITNGISCMGCHKHGMISWKKDDIRPLFEDRRGQKLADKVLQLFPKNDEMRKLVQSDEAFFLRALEQAIGPFLRIGDDSSKTVTEFPEPVSKSSNRYLRDVALIDAARELGLSDASRLEATAGMPRFRSLGLANWSNPNGAISRDNWEKAFRQVARELGLGTPVY